MGHRIGGAGATWGTELVVQEPQGAQNRGCSTSVCPNLTLCAHAYARPHH